MLRSGLAVGRRVVDLCTGSGVVAIAAAEAGAKSVVAVDVSENAVKDAGKNAVRRGVALETLVGPWHRVLRRASFDLVVCNPPYVPEPDEGFYEPGGEAGPPVTYNAGPSGRLVLDPLCNAVPELLNPGGSVLIVQSEFADISRSIRLLDIGGLRTTVVARQVIPFGPVLLSRARWLERQGMVQPGVRTEAIAVIRADKT